MKTNERFLAALRQMNTVMKEDVKAGRKWRYSNSSAKQAHTFALARKKGLRYTNCVLGVWWGLREAGVPDNALHWMGGIHKIIWTTSNAKKWAEKYFDIISTGGHSVSYLWDHQLLCDGDIFLGFQSMNHTCVFYGGSTGKKSFDSGHSNCSGSGELAEFKRWISTLTCKNYKVNYILRLKDRAHYRVQAGAFTDINVYNQEAARLKAAGFPVTRIDEDGMYKIQTGYFSGKSNANRQRDKLITKGFGAFVKEVD